MIRIVYILDYIFVNRNLVLKSSNHNIDLLYNQREVLFIIYYVNLYVKFKMLEISFFSKIVRLVRSPTLYCIKSSKKDSSI